MADVRAYSGRRHVPRVEQLMRALENSCRSYDRGITRCAWAILLLIAWFVVAGTLIHVDDIVYDGRLTREMSVAVTTTSRPDMRVLHRVLGVMAAQCGSEDTALVIGPQVYVNGSPYMFRVMRMCGAGELVNPVIAVSESTTGTCIDEYDGVVRRVLRRYPITVHSDNVPPTSLMELQSVCTFMQALDMLDGKW